MILSQNSNCNRQFSWPSTPIYFFGIKTRAEFHLVSSNETPHSNFYRITSILRLSFLFADTKLFYIWSNSIEMHFSSTSQQKIDTPSLLRFLPDQYESSTLAQPSTKRTNYGQRACDNRVAFLRYFASNINS